MERMLTSDTFLELFEDEVNHKQILPLLHSFGTNLLLQAEKEYTDSALLLNSSNPNKNFKYESYMNMSIIAAITSIFCHNNFEAEKGKTKTPDLLWRTNTQKQIIRQP